MGALGTRGAGHDAADGPEIFRVGQFLINLPAREVVCGDRRIKLSWRGFEALQALVEGKGEIVDRDELFARLWPGVAVGESSLNQCIAKLRRDLGEPPEGGVIETVSRRGYRLTVVPDAGRLTAEVPPAEIVSPPEHTRRARWLWIACAFAVIAALLVGAAYAWSRQSRHMQAMSLVNEGFRQVRENRVAGFAAANTLFRRALDLNSELAPAYSGLAEVMARAGEPSAGQARTMAERAIRLDPRCAECKAIAGWILMGRAWRFREARSYLEEAATQEPQNPRILLWHAQLLACTGQFERALAEIDRARAIDFKQSAVVTMRAGILYLSGRYEESLTAAHEALGLKPDNSSPYDWIYRSCLRLHRVEEALAAKAALNSGYVGLSPDSRFEMEGRWAAAYQKGGLRNLVEVLLAGNSAKPAVDHQRYERATWKMWIGDKEGALDELEQIFDFRPFDAIYVGVDPMFAPLHGEERFRALLALMQLDGTMNPR